MKRPALLHNMSSPPKTQIRFNSGEVPTDHQRVCFATTVQILRLSEKRLFQHCRKHSASRSRTANLWELIERRMARLELPPTTIAYWHIGKQAAENIDSKLQCNDPLSVVATMSKASLPNMKTGIFLKHKEPRNTWRDSLAKLAIREPVSITLLLPQPWRWS